MTTSNEVSVKALLGGASGIRKSEPLRAIGIDETSFQKRHEYVTVVYDTERARVIDVLDGHKQKALEDFYWDTPLEHLETIESVSMDMWGPYIQATLDHIPDADKKIAFDRFHVAKHIGAGVNKVRVDEHADLQQLGHDTLKGSRYLWLQNPENMRPKNRLRFEELAILFHCGGLDLYPRFVLTHTNS